MINAEELKELIEKEAWIFVVVKKSTEITLENIKLSKDYYVESWNGNNENPILRYVDCTYYSEEDGCEVDDAKEIAYINDCFENYAEAEFVLKYKNIERTETLDLPTWEEAEIDELVKSGKSKNGCWNLIKGFTDKKNNEMFEFSLSSDDDNQFYLSVNNEDSSYKDLFYKPLTYENYLEACELCKKLFEGEEDVKD